MTILDLSAIALLVFMAVLAVAVFTVLGSWPSRVARARSHPHEKAVSIGGWVTLLCGGLFYPAVLIWAYAGSPSGQPSAKAEANTA